jgi:hypothetical protein
MRVFARDVRAARRIGRSWTIEAITGFSSSSRKVNRSAAGRAFQLRRMTF